MVLVAQKFDSEIFEICQSLNILLFKARPNRATECLEFDEHFFDFPEVRDDENFYKILREKFGGNNALV